VPTFEEETEESGDNSKRMQQLTPNLLEKAKALRAEGIGWHRITKQLGVSEYVLRCALEPEYRQYKLGLNTRQRAQIAARMVVVKRPRPVSHTAQPEARYGPAKPPADVLAARDLALELRLRPRSVTAQPLGDPLPGRSALDQRRQK
jgi:hypothetical protein